MIGLIWVEFCNAQTIQWKELETPVKASLRGLSPVSDRVCWASGSGGTWLKTTDGGETWDIGVIAGLDTVDFRSIQAFDENTAIVASAGQPAVIYRTVNGGQSWEKVHQEGSEAFFDGISFLDNNRGYIVGDPVDRFWMILETSDGGKSWKSLENLPPAEDGEAAFAASASSMIAFENQLILGTGGKAANLHFYDFGKKSWEKVKTPILQGQSSQGIFAIVKTESNIIVVGGDYTKLDFMEKNAFLYKDQLFQLPVKSPRGYRSGIAYLPYQRLSISVGPSGSDVSFDDGENWQSFSPLGFHAVKLSLDQQSIWSSGSEGRIGLLILR